MHPVNLVLGQAVHPANTVLGQAVHPANTVLGQAVRPASTVLGQAITYFYDIPSFLHRYRTTAFGADVTILALP